MPPREPLGPGPVPYDHDQPSEGSPSRPGHSRLTGIQREERHDGANTGGRKTAAQYGLRARGLRACGGARGIPATPGAIGSLAEQAGLEGWRVINRMAGADMTYKGRSLGLLVDALELDQEERRRLALAFAFEEDPAAVARE